MTKDGFIRELEECLLGEVSSGQLSESLDYYRSYMEEEIRAGKTEDQVTADLGSPRLIARSIIDAYGTDDHIIINDEYVQEEDGDGQGESYDSQGEFVRRRRAQSGSLVSQRIVFYAVVIGIIIAAGALIHLLMPVILLVMVIWFIMRIFSR